VSKDPSTSDTGTPGRYFALFLLIIVYTLNFLDRQILSILKEPIAAELGLSDTDLGKLGGLAFAMLYSVLAVPAAWLADRYSRVWIMTGALFIWSGFTAICGLAGNYTQLFFARMGVGVGEAGGVAPAYSLIADYFPPKSRARALAVYSLGIPLGSAAGALFGGLMAAHVDWRWAFISIGLFGVALAPIFRLVVKDPVRGGNDIKPVATVKPLNLLEVAKLAATKPSFWLLSLGAACSSMVGYGLLYWFPTFLARSLKMDIVSRSEFIAASLVISGLIGLFCGGWIADKFGAKNKGAYAFIPAISFLIAAPLYAMTVLAKTPHEAFFLILLPQALGLVWLGPVVTAVQHLAPASSRSVMSSLFLLVNNLIGLSVGPYAFGKISDVLKPQYGVESIKWAFVGGLGFYVIAAILLTLAAMRLKKDWVD
jgi:MFS transporter, Spinster family, sphingosine-1-phosphate transporter